MSAPSNLTAEIARDAEKGAEAQESREGSSSTPTPPLLIVGLCMGHDVLFSKFSEAPVTTLVVQDRVMCHNPAAPLVNPYWRDTFLKKA